MDDSANSKKGKGEKAGIRFALRAMSHRNYRLYFIGQGVSLTGTWMQRIAMQWLVYRLTGSAFLLGVVGFAGQIPVFLLAALGGVMADRWDRHKALVVTQTLAMLQALAVAILTLTGRIEEWHIIALSLFIGIVNAFDMPLRQAFIVEMVEGKEDLSNAIALNSFVFNSARLVGPSLAGVLIAALGEGPCFLLNAISFIGVIGALLAMRVKRKEIRRRAGRVWQELKEGFAYAFGFAPIRSLLLLAALVALVGMPYTVLMPVFATDVLHGGPSTLGLLMAATGVGAIIGAWFLAPRRNAAGLETVIAVAAGTFGMGLVLLAQSRALWLALLLLVLTGFGMMVQSASNNTMLQTIVDDDKRGRVMSFYNMAFMGVTPFGSLLGGALADRIGTPGTLMACGVACALAALLFASRLGRFRAQVRPIYERLGFVEQQEIAGR
jgi:MFS family permease